MKFNPSIIILNLLFGFLLISCQEQSLSDRSSNTLSNNFKRYWYTGKAELNSYHLIQSRYGEERIGKAILIFVTEDFSKTRHVKLDDQVAAGTDKLSVLKLNMTKNFVTGIYPYSMMLSVFTPVEISQNPHALKLTMSAQEWCGQVYSQFNLRHDNYVVTSHSYFENEADEALNLKATWLEDELWNRVRLDPESLPIGEIEMIPGLFFARLNHVPLTVEKAVCSITANGDQITYLVKYPKQDRSLEMKFEKNFPHRINSWTETVSIKGKTYTTSATLDKQLITDYWSKNKNEFLYLRDSLGLSHQNY